MPIRVLDLWHTYGSGAYALKGLTLTMDEGETTLIIGRNGAGKSTLLKHLNGLLKPTRGDVLVGNLNTRAVPPAVLARYVALNFQNPDDQIFCQTVREEVAYGPNNLHLPHVKPLVEEVLTLTGLQEVETCHPYDLHPSRRRLLALASTLALDANFIALDEPTAGMSFAEKERLERIWAWLTAKHKTPIVISHDLDFFFPLCTRLIIFDHGEVVYDGPKREFLHTKKARSILKRASLALPILPRLGRYVGLPQPVTTMSEFIKEYHLAWQRQD